MELQDKIGRDLAQDLLNQFESIHRGDPARIAIFKSTKMYKFFLNNGLETHDYSLGRRRRSQKTGGIILPFEVDKQLKAEIITENEANRLLLMIKSENQGDYIIAEGVITMNRIKRKKKK